MAREHLLPDGGADATQARVGQPTPGPTQPRTRHPRVKHPRTKHPRVKHPRAKQPRAKRPRRPDVPATTRAPLATGGDPWHAAAHAAGAASPALELTPPTTQGLGDVLLELAGAEHGALRSLLAAWQREQDRVSNRAWRRPGGLRRPGGV